MSPIRMSPENTEGTVFVRNTCGRCGGCGQLAAWDESSRQQVAVWCPICRGTGEAQYFQSEGNPSANLPTVRRYADGAPTRSR